MQAACKIVTASHVFRLLSFGSKHLYFACPPPSQSSAPRLCSPFLCCIDACTSDRDSESMFKVCVKMFPPTNKLIREKSPNRSSRLLWLSKTLRILLLTFCAHYCSLSALDLSCRCRNYRLQCGLSACFGSLCACMRFPVCWDCVLVL